VRFLSPALSLPLLTLAYALDSPLHARQGPERKGISLQTSSHGDAPGNAKAV
jgi:hypothetical protein